MKSPTFLFALLFVLPLSAVQDDHYGHDHNTEAAADGEHHQHEHVQPADAVDRLLDRSGSAQGTVWTCPMHPQISRDGPGQCPICGMNLVRREASGDDGVTVRVSGRIQQSMNLRTIAAERGRLGRRIDTVGRVQADENRLLHLHPRVEGWIGELDVNAEGEAVEAGQRLFTLYSRELINAQEEFLRTLSSGDDMARAARQRLAALDVRPGVISEIEREREVIEYLPWYAERAGYVRTLNIRPGMFVSPGSDMIVTADPDRVWVIADIFTGQIAWIEPGQPVKIVREAKPGDVIEAEVDFIYPELDPETRTARARIELKDTGLRPGEWLQVTILAEPADHVLYVPSEAVIESGSGARVVVREDDQHFSVREVRTGMVSGQSTEILEGISEGEEVVTSGQFLIDSEANLRAGHDRLSGGHEH